MAMEEKATSEPMVTLLRTHLNEKSVQIYLRSWEEFLKSGKIAENEVPTEAHYMRYFQYLRHEKKYKISSLFCVFSKLNTCHQRISGRRLQEWPKLLKFLKDGDHPESVRKAKTFSFEDLKQFVLDKKRDNKYWLVRKAVITFAFFGGHRVSELRRLRMENLESCQDGIHVTFERATKAEFIPKRLKYLIPKRDPRISNPLESTCWCSVIERYLELVHADVEDTSEGIFYTARDSRTARFFITPMGKNMLGRVGKEVAEALGKPYPEEYTGICWRRMAARASATSFRDKFMFPSHENQEGPRIINVDTVNIVEAQDRLLPLETDFVGIKEELPSPPVALRFSDSFTLDPNLEDSKDSSSEEFDSGSNECDKKANGQTFEEHIDEEDGLCDLFAFDDLVDKFASIVKFMASDVSTTKAKKSMLKKLNSLPLGLIEINEDQLKIPVNYRE